ncbi:MAG: hypothetical protein HC780_10515 [Leptolyngbyaceae cyanobacterium CSU_1_3]|nr:hypothetical protein [Leptolyngbyaceae cyanobacterium CSU_1_3]
MFGTFQQSNLRIEVNASEAALRSSLASPAQFPKWLWFERFSAGLPDAVRPGLTFKSWVGAIAIHHQVELVEPNRVRFLLSQGIDGFHEWSWGDGWIQSRIEGISVLPINLGQTLSLLCLKQFLSQGIRDQG